MNFMQLKTTSCIIYFYCKNKPYYQVKQMTYEGKNLRIDKLEPSKLSQSIKSGGQPLKISNGISYQPYYSKETNTIINGKDDYKKTITKTQEIYASNEADIGEGNFKKPKSFQIDKLNELKKQYEVLRNIKIEDSVIYSQKKPKKVVESSQEYSEREEGSVSMKSMKNKNYGLIQYQKKQLQIMLANSMNKIEEMLRAEMEYKRKIYELTRLNEESPNFSNQQMIKRLQLKEQSNLQAIELLKQEEEKERKINRSLSQKLRSIESQLFNMESEVRKVNDEKKRLQQTLFYEKQAHMSIKIEIKKIQLEKDMLEKQKNIEAQRLNRTIDDLTAERQRLSGKIQKLQGQMKTLTHKKIDESSLKTRIENIDKEENFHTRLTQKLKELERVQQQQMKKQMSLLKQQMETMRQHTEDINKITLQKRIQALQKIINDDNEEKMGFLEELKRMLKDFQELENENAELKDRLRILEKQLRISKENSIYEIQKLERSQKISRLSSSEEQMNNAYVTKIKKLQVENKNLRSQVSRIQDSLSHSQIRVQQRIKQYSRKLEESQFQIQKLHKQNEFNLEISNAKYKAEIQLAKNDLTRTIKQKNEEKEKYEQTKAFYENKISSLNRQHEQIMKNLNERLRAKEQEIAQAKGVGDENLMRIKKQYENEIFTLLNRLQQVVKSNQRYVSQNARLMGYEAQLYQLRQRVRRITGVSDGVDHLWSIKQAQYYNLNEILKEMKG